MRTGRIDLNDVAGCPAHHPLITIGSRPLSTPHLQGMPVAPRFSSRAAYRPGHHDLQVVQPTARFTPRRSSRVADHRGNYDVRPAPPDPTLFKFSPSKALRLRLKHARGAIPGTSAQAKRDTTGLNPRPFNLRLFKFPTNKVLAIRLKPRQGQPPWNPNSSRASPTSRKPRRPGRARSTPRYSSCPPAGLWGSAPIPPGVSHSRRDNHADDCGQASQSKPSTDSNPSRTGMPTIPDRVVIGVSWGQPSASASSMIALAACVRSDSPFSRVWLN
jgi:hypothetical protein